MMARWPICICIYVGVGVRSNRHDGIGLTWIALLDSSAGLYVYTHKLMAYLAPPFTVVFLFSLVFVAGP